MKSNKFFSNLIVPLAFVMATRKSESTTKLAAPAQKTGEAIREAFTLITSDPKVTAIFVNIFGGIVRCDAIAQGLISVVESMNLSIPIIARLQGTNMEAAQKLINDAGLKIFSIDDLQNAAEKAVQFSKVVKMGKSLISSSKMITNKRQLVTLTWELNSLLVFKRSLPFRAFPCVLIPSSLDDWRVCIMQPFLCHHQICALI